MSNTVSVVIEAQTAEAAAAIKAFAQQSAGALNVLSAGSKKLAEDAQEASTHIAGMAYYFRSGIDSIRFAVAGGGERAGFYAIDEGVRALIASGMKLGTLVPIIGAVGAAVTAGVYIFKDWNKAQEEAEQHAKNLAEAWKALPDLIAQINKMQNVGLLSPAAEAEYADYLTGRKKLYVDRQTGQVTPNATTTLPAGEAGSIPSAVIAQGTSKNGLLTVPNDEASLAQKQQWAKDQYSAGGELAKQQVDALDQLRGLVQRLNEESLSGIAKQKAEIHDRYQAERDQLRATIQNAQTLYGSINFNSLDVVKEARAKFASLSAQEDAEIMQLEQDKATTTVSPAEMREQDAKNFEESQKQIEDGFTTLVEVTKKKREDFYREEYQVRVKSAQEALYQGQITEDQYRDVVSKAAAQMAESQQKVNEKLRQEASLRQEIARAAIESKLKGIQDDSLLTQQQKTAQSIPLYQQQMQLNAGRIGQLAGVAATSADQSAQLEAQKQIVDLTNQQVELQQKLNAAYGASSWTYQLQQALTNLRDMPPLAQQVGTLLQGTVKTGMDSIASNMTRVIEGTEKWRKALLNIAESVMTQMIEGLIQVVEKLLLQLAIDVAIKAVSGGAFAEGGRPGVGEISLVGEEGRELFIPDTAGTIIPNGMTERILQGRGDTGGFSNTVEGHKVNLHFYDSRPHPRDYLSSGAGEQQIVDIARKNRVKIGVGT